MIDVGCNIFLKQYEGQGRSNAVKSDTRVAGVCNDICVVSYGIISYNDIVSYRCICICRVEA